MDKHEIATEKVSDKRSTATLVGGNTDGKNLFLEVEVFDGEHTNKLHPIFPAGTTGESVISYMKELIEKEPVFPVDLASLIQTTLYWDKVNESWYVKYSNGVSAPLKPKEAKEVNKYSNK